MPSFGQAHGDVAEVRRIDSARTEVTDTHWFRGYRALPRLSRTRVTALRQRRTSSSSSLGRAKTYLTAFPLCALTTQSIAAARAQKATTDAKAAPTMDINWISVIVSAAFNARLAHTRPEMRSGDAILTRRIRQGASMAVAAVAGRRMRKGRVGP